MKVEGYFFAFVAVFLAITGAVYWFLSEDPTGSTAIVFSAGLALICGSYLLFTARRIEPRPEDRADAEISDGAGELGFFSPFSYWPIALAGGATVAGLGIAFGIWVLLIGVGLLAFTVVGLLFEYYVGADNKAKGGTFGN